MGVGISPERGERADRAVGGRSERIPEPETELLVGHASEPDLLTGRASDAFAGRWSEAGSASERESGAWLSAERSPKAGPAAARTTGTRPFFSDGPATDLLADPANDPGPHEITIQLDGTSRELDDLLVQQAKDGTNTMVTPVTSASPETSDGPVFVDASGRRSRRFRRLGMLVAVACAVYAVVIVATLLSGNSNAPWLPVPGQEEDQPAGRVDTSPLPTKSVNPAGRGNAVVPGVPPAATDGTTPSPRATTSPGTSAKATAPSASSDPKPSKSATKKPKPGAVTTKDPDPDPSPSTDGPPTPSAPATTPSTPAPTESTAGGGSTGAGEGTP
jgi:hypothetical protein